MKTLYILVVAVMAAITFRDGSCTEIPQRVNIFVLARPAKQENKDEPMTKADEADHLRLLFELLGNRNLPPEPAVSGTGLRDHRPVNYELFSDNTNKLRPRESSKSSDGMHQEYHVHYHSHNHHNGFVKQVPSTSDPRAPHLAAFKDFETLLKKKEKSKPFTSESGIKSSYNQMGAPRIQDFPGGSPRISERLSYLKASDAAEGRERYMMRASDKAEYFSEFPIENVQYKEPQPLITVRKLKRTANNMNGWVIQRWL